MPFFQDCYVGCQFYVNRHVISQPVLNWGQWREVTRETRDSGGEYQLWYKMLRCVCLFVFRLCCYSCCSCYFYCWGLIATQWEKESQLFIVLWNLKISCIERLLHGAGAPNENIVQKHLNIA